MIKTSKIIASIFALAMFFSFACDKHQAHAATFSESVFYYTFDQTDFFKDKITNIDADTLESHTYQPAVFDYGAKSNGDYYYTASATSTGSLAADSGDWACVSFWVKHISGVDPYYDTIFDQSNISGTFSDYYSVNFKKLFPYSGLSIQFKWNDNLGNYSIMESNADIDFLLDDSFHNVIMCRQSGVNLGDLYVDGEQVAYTITNPSITPYYTATGDKPYFLGGDYLFKNFLVDDLVYTRGRFTEQQVINLQSSSFQEVINDEVATSTAWDFYLSTVNCCAGLQCAVPITFTRGADGYNLVSGLDLPVCNAFATGTPVIFDYWAGTPSSIVFPAADAGDHLACLLLSNGGEPISATIQTISYYATTSPYCISTEISTSSFAFCEKPCAGIASTTSLWNGFICGMKEAGCWFVVPFENANNYISGGFNLLKTKFPASLYFDLTDSFAAGLEQTTDDRTQTFGIPMIRQTGTGSEYYILPVIDASSTEKTIGKENANLFRQSQIWFIWIATACFIIIFLAKNIK